MYALYTGQSFDWTLFGATARDTIATVTPKAFTNFQDRLGKYSQHTQSPEAQLAVSTIARMTTWETTYRSSASNALQVLLQTRTSQAHGTIALKETRERLWRDD